MSVAVRGLCLLLWCPVLPAQDAKGGLLLPFEESRHTWRLKREVDEPESARPMESSVRGELWLLRNRFEVRTEESRTVYDFERDVLIQIDERRRTWTETSLLARILGRQGEYQHHRRVADLLRRMSKRERPSADPFFVSARFGLQTGNAPAVASAERDGTTEVRYKGQLIASWRPSDRELDLETCASLERALWWRESLHPVVRRLLANTHRVPSRLQYVAYDLGMRSDVEIVFGPPRDVGGGALELGGLTRAWNADDPLDAAASAVFVPGQPAVPGRDACVEEARRALDKGNALEAFLVMTAWSLQSGDADAIHEVLGARVADDPAMQRLLGAITRIQKEPEEAAAALRALDRSRLRHGYLIDTFLATALATGGRHDEAADAMLAALRRNPQLAGSWKELGDLYHRRQDLDRAWLAWDVARRLSPNLKSLRPVLDLEAKLTTEFQAFL